MALTAQGVDGMLRLGDTTYQVVLGPREPGRLVLQALHIWTQEIKCELASQDYHRARVRVGLEASSTLTSERDLATKATSTPTSQWACARPSTRPPKRAAR